MKTVGIFEAKTHLSEICDQVARSGLSVVITRRGKPLVRIDPMVATAGSVWEERATLVAEGGRFGEEFDVPPRSPELPASPLEE